MMDKKSHNNDINITPGKEIDPDDLAHEYEIIPDSVEEQDIDDLVHSVKAPEIEAGNEEKDIDDLMHEGNDGADLTGPTSGE